MDLMGSSTNTTTSSSEKSSSSSKCRRLGDILPATPTTSNKTARTSSDSAKQSSRSGGSSPGHHGQQQHQHQHQRQRSCGSPTDSSTAATAATEDHLLHTSGSISSPPNSFANSSSSSQHSGMILMPPPTMAGAGPSAVSASSYGTMGGAMAMPGMGGGGGAMNLARSPMLFQQQPAMKQSMGFQQQLAMGSASSLLGLHEAFMASRYPFTSLQWAELEHQALVFKYILARAPVPPELIAPIRSTSFSSILGGGGSWPCTIPSSANAGSGHGVHTNHLDAEPGRCRRTDGKKWRCARPIVPDQKYCERHINRGRHKKKSSAATAAAVAAAAAATTGGGGMGRVSSTTSTSTSTSSTSGIIASSHGGEHHPGELSTAFEISNASSSMFHHHRSSSLADARTRKLARWRFLPARGVGSHFVCVRIWSLRFLNGISKATSFDLRPEQLLLSEVPGGSAAALAAPGSGISANQSNFPGAAARGGVNPTSAAAPPPFFQLPKSNASSTSNSASSNPDSPYFSYSKLFHNASDESQHCLSSLLASPPQHQHNQQLNYYASDPSVAEKIKPDTSHALRPLFNEWPRSRDASTMTSWSDSDDRKPCQQQLHKLKLGGGGTHLSISIPSTASGGSHEDGGGNDSMVKLCMGSSVEELTDSATNGGGGGGGGSSGGGLIKPGGGVVELGWFSAARASVGGPLAEAFNASEVKSSGLTFLGGSARDLRQLQVVSPTGVLQRSGLGSFSESSSSASSPGSIKVEQLH
ncbi:hypothetical protein SELMODRAFT_412762 [Selaginella moellendorffii]|uniref:Growth-regulating factor n=1 Tax=Selaginella moellendorffii TaxID=88036 RepID=D8RLE2_SELML|nr:hypothetical protein SELMODRAFT_412762 [Selaginella moellendorffii]